MKALRKKKTDVYTHRYWKNIWVQETKHGVVEKEQVETNRILRK